MSSFLAQRPLYQRAPAPATPTPSVAPPSVAPKPLPGPNDLYGLTAGQPPPADLTDYYKRMMQAYQQDQAQLQPYYNQMTTLQQQLANQANKPRPNVAMQLAGY